MDTDTIIIVSLSAAAWVLLLIVVLILTCQISRLKKQVADIMANPRLKAQKLAVAEPENHAFHNPVISPDEELSRRGYSMYVADDVESGRGTSERQTGGQFIEELTQELETRQHRRSPPPPFLLNAIEDNKRKSRTLTNPVANTKINTYSNGTNNQNQARIPSETNPNFIY